MRILALTLLLAGALAGFRFFDDETEGNRAYRRGDYEKAVQLYRSALATGEVDPRLRYNLGTALLRLGETAAAVEHLERALEGHSPELRARTFYNLGNARARGEGGAPSAGDLRKAIDAYRRSLLLQPDREDVRWNLELAMRQLERVEEAPPTDSGEPETESPEGRQGAGADAAAGDREPPASGPDVGERMVPGGEDATAPLPRELAEQILRAVEEQERGLQREKLRGSKKRATGPDW